MPLNYRVQLALSSVECLEDGPFSVEACTDTLAFMKEIEKLYEISYNSRILADAAQLTSFPQLLGENFLDYESGVISIDEERLKEACKAYCSMYEEEMTANLGEFGYYGYGKDIVEQNAYLSNPQWNRHVFNGSNCDRGLRNTDYYSNECGRQCFDSYYTTICRNPCK